MTALRSKKLGLDYYGTIHVPLGKIFKAQRRFNGYFSQLPDALAAKLRQTTRQFIH
ncbi:MAG: hypothetical protein R2836_00565 [Chitinophagales bacterium]